MTLGPVMIDLIGTEITPVERDMLLHPNTGGVILFTRNFESIEQLESLTQEIHSLRHPHLLIAVDHEGGRVQRFHDGFTRLPAMAIFGRLYKSNKDKAKQLAEKTGWLMAAECLAAGIDFSFAPVLDLGHGISGVIGDRAFDTSADVITILAHEFMRGMKRAGMAATGKHFPGHGSVKEDSHVGHPVDRRSLADIMMDDSVPFERMISYGLAAVMPAHVVYPQVDDKPAGYSERWLKDILRKQLHFEGAIFSDDLSMQAAAPAGSFTDRARAALDAGCDMVLVCNHSAEAKQVLNGLGDYNNPASAIRLIRMHGHKHYSRAQLHANKEWQETAALIAPLTDSPLLELDV
ncbi:MAG: beta-N-acetylhexosaminidase [Gammaproteobacteria bacterium]|nr:beta-N-acetylhexosaminidase [Gammaproteobacteria bacterium]